MSHPNLTAKQEKFVQAYLKTGNQRTAYTQAYQPKGWKVESIDQTACRLLKNVKVHSRLKEMQERAASKTVVTVEKITEMLNNAYSLACKNGQTGPAVQASMGLAKIHGLVVDKREDVTKHDEALDDLE
jgi:phage terminase small subunit